MFQQMESNQTQHVHFFNDPVSQLRAIIAIHSTTRGPAIGGCRFIPYSNDEDAFVDALRLARGMSYKSALAGLPHGGAKAVILYPEGTFDRAALMQQFGRCVDTLGGAYITAMDSGTQIEDMDNIATKTRFVTCTSETGDPSSHTALGVVEGIKAAVKFKLNRSSLKGIKVSIQGLGHVGYDVARRLHTAGAILTVADIDPERVHACVHDFDAKAVLPEEIYQVETDVFCPCGLGAILNSESITQLRTRIVAGSANNQLAEENDGNLLYQRGILYAPDYLINAGGLIFIASQYSKLSKTALTERVIQIGPALYQLFQQAMQSGSSTHLIANQKAENILSAAEKLTSAA